MLIIQEYQVLPAVRVASCQARHSLRRSAPLSALERAALAVYYQSSTKSATERFARSCPLACTTGIRCYVLVQYEWDDGKAAENFRKHGGDFADAIAAVEDPNRFEEIDGRLVYGEERVHVIGMARDKVLFVVVTLPGEDTCRIISARKATRHEQDRYYAGDRETWLHRPQARLTGPGLTP